MTLVNPTPERELIARRLAARSRPMASGCTEITGHLNKGYGQIVVGEWRRQAHRVAYELFIGRIPKGYEVHHTCENKACVNPAHLQALTTAEHTKRHPRNATTVNAVKTRCDRGHEFTPENTYSVNGGRACLACRRAKSREWIKANAEKARLASANYRARKHQQSQGHS